ncbi:MAG: hypothetical protein K1W24_16050 [Lachnospiraceae bacterium]
MSNIEKIVFINIPIEIKVQLYNIREDVCQIPQIIHIKNLKNTSGISGMCHKPDGFVYITKNGYGGMVVVGMEIYESAIR